MFEIRPINLITYKLQEHNHDVFGNIPLVFRSDEFSLLSGWIFAKVEKNIIIEHVEQETSWWCWIASAVMFMKHYFPFFGTKDNQTQEACALAVKGTTADPSGSAYDSLKYFLGTIGSSLDVTCTHEKIYSEDTLMKFLDDGHVLIIHRLWYNYQNGMYVFDNIRVGHFYVLSGYVTIQGKTWFILHDPSNSDDDESEATLMTYQKLRCGYDRTEDELRDDGFWCCAIVVNTEYSKNTISWKEPNG